MNGVQDGNRLCIYFLWRFSLSAQQTNGRVVVAVSYFNNKSRRLVSSSTLKFMLYMSKRKKYALKSICKLRTPNAVRCLVGYFVRTYSLWPRKCKDNMSCVKLLMYMCCRPRIMHCVIRAKVFPKLHSDYYWLIFNRVEHI